MENKSEISEFYAHKKVFVTGATGFIGKILIWKLLQSCPLIDTIYVLLRSKKSKSAELRREELIQLPIFEIFRKNNPSILNKIVAIAGDVGEPNLGLSDSDKNILLKEISIVFHGAAMLKMDIGLKQAINVNTKGVIRMLDMAMEMEKLSTFVYISTAYSCCDESEVEEKLYFIKGNPRDVIKAIDWLPDKILNKITKDLISPHPNTYTFSKKLTELVSSEYEAKVPIIIARPTMVINSHKEPFPGWIANVNGPAGIAIGTGKGVLHSMQVNPKMKGDLVPADIVCNGLISMVWVENLKKQLFHRIQIYNLAVCENSCVTWREFQIQCTKASLKYPFETMLWYPTFDIIEENKYKHQFAVIFYHWLPAYLIDFILLLIGKKRFLVRIQKKIVNGVNLVGYFARKQWTFRTDNLLRMKQMMNKKDKELFPVTMANVKYEKHVEVCTIAVKKYMFNEDMANLPKCHRRLTILYVVKIVAQIIIYAFLINVLWKILRSVYNNIVV